MKRLFILFAVFLTALSFIFLAAQPSNAQPTYQESQPENQPPPQEPPREGQPESELLDSESEVDWANVKMGSGEENNLPSAATPPPIAPAAPEDLASEHSEPEDETSPPPVIEAPTPPTEQITHIVGPGETLYRIAKRYGISLAQLIATNNIQNPNRIQIGQALIIPGPDRNVQDEIATAQDDTTQDGVTQDGATQDVVAQSSDDTYTVLRGDKPYEIAQRFGVDVETLMAVNQISNPRRMSVGQVLIIPHDDEVPQVAVTPISTAITAEPVPTTLATVPAAPDSPDTYVVQRGDKPFEIARQFGVDVGVLMAVNQISDPRRMNVGQVLTIPHDDEVPEIAVTPVPPVITAEQDPTTLTIESTTPDNPDTYVVQRGDKPFEIAERFGVDVGVLMAINQISNPRRLNVGQVLTIPHEGDTPATDVAPNPAALTVEPATTSSTGPYVVQRGDNLFRIARRFGVNIQELIDANNISNPNRINPGQTLTIPGITTDSPPESLSISQTEVTPEPSVTSPLEITPENMTTPQPEFTPEPPVTSQPEVTPEPPVTSQPEISPESLTTPQPEVTPEPPVTSQPEVAPESLITPQPEVTPEPSITSQPEIPPVLAIAETMAEATNNSSTSDEPFIWPVPLQDGWISKWYSFGHPGIDIILPIGTPIRASAGGIVEFSGWNAYGFGNLVVLDHGNGYRSLYAHQSERLVANGDVVAQGDIIGLVGITGRATHPHLHFEIRHMYPPVNPCDYLPGGCQQ